MAVTPLIDETELRELLVEAEIEVDPERMARMLAAVQPMRVMLRKSGDGRRRAMLRGAALDVGWVRPDAAPAWARPLPRARATSAVEAPSAPSYPPTLRHLIARLFAIYIACVAGMFALMMMAGESVGGTIVFGTGAAALLLLAITGRGLGGRFGGDEPPGAGTVLGLILFIVSGAGPLLAIAVASIVIPNPSERTDFIAIAGKGVGLVTLYVVGSHWRAVRRAGG